MEQIYVRIKLPVNELMNLSERQQRVDRFILHENPMFMVSNAKASYRSINAFTHTYQNIIFIFGHSISMNKHERNFYDQINKKLFIKSQQRMNILYNEIY